MNMAVIKDKFIFVHAPKCGGTSVTRALGGTSHYVPMHVPARCLEHLELPMIGFIRNPWERMSSLFYFLWQSPPRHRQRVQPEKIKAMGFKRWLLQGENWMSNEPVDGQISWYGTDMQYKSAEAHPYPGMELLPHPELGLPPQQRRSLRWYFDDTPTFVGKVESLQRDLNAFCKLWKLPIVHVPHVNRTRAKPRDWRKDFDNEMIDFVSHYFAWDIKVGEYSFE